MRVKNNEFGEKSIGANLNIYDENKDGAPDGLEAYFGEFTGNTTDFMSGDSDNDGLPDLIEINAYIWAYNNPDEAPTDKYLWINPLVYDAYNDSDSDGLTNIEEWERSGYIMDFDRDDIPNFYDTDDDNDKLPTSVELSADLNPFNSADAHGDKDGNE